MAFVTAGLFVLWGQSAGHARDYGVLPVGRGLSLPPHTEAANPPPWWALIFALAADGALPHLARLRCPVSVDLCAELDAADAASDQLSTGARIGHGSCHCRDRGARLATLSRRQGRPTSLDRTSRPSRCLPP